MRTLLVEGHDGAGKTTFCNYLEERMKETGLKIDRLKFPLEIPDGRWPAEDSIILIDDFQRTLNPYLQGEVECDLLLVDRAFPSTLIYQGEEFEMRATYHALRSILERPFVELQYRLCYLSCDPEVASSRAEERSQDKEDPVDRLTKDERTRRIRLIKEDYDRLLPKLDFEGDLIRLDSSERTTEELYQDFMKQY